jgi:uncharacterized membrane protein YphA (DoxX/SURF4 family)
MAPVYITSALPKIRHTDLFAAAILNYKMLPPWGVNTLALMLPWLELAIGVLLALGVWVRASAAWMVALMIVFMIAFVSATARGLDIACGCFEVAEGAKPTSPWWVVLRDSTMLGAALVLFRFGGGPGLGRWVVAPGARRRPTLDASTTESFSGRWRKARAGGRLRD